MLFLVATNVVASRPPERRPTGTPHARANIWIDDNIFKINGSVRRSPDSEIRYILNSSNK